MLTPFGVPAHPFTLAPRRWPAIGGSISGGCCAGRCCGLDRCSAANEIDWAFSFRPFGRSPLSIREYRSRLDRRVRPGSTVGASGDGNGELSAHCTHSTLRRAYPKTLRAVVGELHI